MNHEHECMFGYPIKSSGNYNFCYHPDCRPSDGNYNERLKLEGSITRDIVTGVKRGQKEASVLWAPKKKKRAIERNKDNEYKLSSFIKDFNDHFA